MVYSRFGRKLIYFLVIAAAVLFVAALLQTSFLPQVGLFGAIPDLVLILVCGVAFYLGPVDGAAFGLVGGILIECFGGAGLAAAPVLYFLMGLAFGVLAKHAFVGKFFHWLVYCVLFCIVKAGYSLLRIVMASGFSNLFDALGASVLPELLGTFLLALALAVPVRVLAGALRGRMSLKKGKGGLGEE